MFGVELVPDIVVLGPAVLGGRVHKWNGNMSSDVAGRREGHEG
jgi:hypothetical protein